MDEPRRAAHDRSVTPPSKARRGALRAPAWLGERFGLGRAAPGRIGAAARRRAAHTSAGFNVTGSDRPGSVDTAPAGYDTLGAGFAAGGAVALVIVALLAILVPLPTPLIDLLLASALAFGVALLVAAITIDRPHELSGFPALLLGATLLRLAVNVSTTRRILGTADAGRVIDAFASVVAGSDLVVGLVVFGIVTMLQWMVVARGAERIAEVAARFSLDAMPGEQAAIDVDLRAGAISATEAALRRARLIERARFHGAMDGAMRFVKGDALLGLAITATNLAGGLAVGLAREGMGAMDALEVYGRLTIGDGLAMQIPSVLTSLAAGLLVARAERSEGERIAASPRVHASWIATPAALCLALALIPGMPSTAFVIVGLTLGAAAWRISTRGEAPVHEEAIVEIELPRDDEALSRGLTHALVQQVAHELGVGPVRCAVRVSAHVTARSDDAVDGVVSAAEPRVRIAGRELPSLDDTWSTARRADGTEADPKATDGLSREMLVALRVMLLRHADGLTDLRWIEARLQLARRSDAALVDRALRRVDAIELLALVRHLLRERIPVPEMGVVLRAVVERIERGEIDPREMFVPLARARLSPWWLPELIESLGGNDAITWLRTTPDFEDAAAGLLPLATKPPVDLSLAEAPRRKLVALRQALGLAAGGTPAVVLTAARVRPIIAALAREASPNLWVLSREEHERGACREPGRASWLDVPASGV
jgi:type III secretion protein V